MGFGTEQEYQLLNEESLQNLIAMGFSRELSQIALTLSKGEPNVAAHILWKVYVNIYRNNHNLDLFKGT